MCFVCLVFTPQHDNLLQFKESFCVRGDNLASVCSRITGDFILYTIVKVPSIPVPCPFQGPYSFSYTNQSRMVDCSEPVSEIQACADKSRFIFHYRHCNKMPETHNIKLNFQCMATWDNGEKFLYGKFTGPGLIDKQQMYRCFMYSFWSTHGEMSMSADASCQGLQSTRVGVLTMRLRHRLKDWPRPSCVFPDYFTSIREWRDIGGQYRIQLYKNLNEFRIMDIVDPEFVKYGEERAETRLSAKCIKHKRAFSQSGRNSESTMSQEAEVITYTTNDSCVSAYQCIRMKNRAPGSNVVELLFGWPSEDRNSSCEDHHFINAHRHVLIPLNSQPSPCPMRGGYSYVEKMSDCRGKIDIGCTDKTQMVVEASCPSGHRSVEILQCYQNWTDLKTKTMYIIASRPGDSRKLSDCLAYKQSIDGFEIVADENCGGGNLRIMNKAISFIIQQPPEKCEAPEPKVQPEPSIKTNTDIESPEDLSDENNDVTNTHINIINNGSVRTVTFQCIMFSLVLTFAFAQR